MKERWRALITELAPSVPGDWEIRGSGWRTSLVRQPEPWTIAWIGFTKSAYSDEGWFHAGVAPLVTHHFNWGSPFTVRTDRVEGFPKAIDLTNPGVGEVLREFAVGPAIEKIERGLSSVLASGAEKNYARAQRPRRPPHYWLMVPGWRVVLGTDSPEAPAAEAVEFYTELGDTEAITFYQTLLDTWKADGREGTLTFLEADRVRKIRAGGLRGMKIV